ncbi:MAG: PEP-CTERM sorting domain-containing protein [Verrucomicrobia bacterium]|nr:PEP-CTERM sorting domain-containing protein [Verrucomicrobiota bacterium]
MSAKFRGVVGVVAVVFCYMALTLSSSATLVSYWDMDETSSPYANSQDGVNPLLQDPGSTTAGSVGGISGNAAYLNYQDPGPSTRVVTTSDPQSSSTFGFSFFINPQFVGAGDQFVAAEATGGTISTRAFDYWTWAVRAVTVGGGLGLEFIVRGQGGVGNEGFASQVSGEVLADGGGQSGHWYHIAGGYDSGDGSIDLYVRDMTDDPSATAYSGSGDSGMTTHGAGFSLGTTAYNGGYVNFSAGTYIDEVSLYDSTLTALDVANIESAVPEPNTMILLAVGGLLVSRRVRRRRS